MGASTLSSRAIIGEYYARLEQNTGLGYVNLIGTEPFPSDQAAEEYKWLGQSPSPREWIGGRQAKGLSENGVIIKNRKFESTLEISCDDIRRDKTAQIMTRVREMADRDNAHWAKLICAALVAGESTVCYDGQYFFDTDHAEGDSGAQSNSLTYSSSTPTTPTVAQFSGAILKSMEGICGFVDNSGEPMNEEAQEFVVMVPVPFLSTAAAAIGSEIIVDGSTSRSNTVMAAGALGGFRISLRATPRLASWTTKFGVFRADGNVKPIIRQEEEALRLSAIAEGSELEFNEDKWRFGTKAIRNVGYGYWQHAVLMTFT